MRRLRGEELFASFSGKGRVIERQDDVADWDLPFSLVLLDFRRKIILLYISRPIPWSKEAIFSKVSVQRKKNDQLVPVSYNTN